MYYDILATNNAALYVSSWGSDPENEWLRERRAHLILVDDDFSFSISFSVMNSVYSLMVGNRPSASCKYDKVLLTIIAAVVIISEVPRIFNTNSATQAYMPAPSRCCTRPATTVSLV